MYKALLVQPDHYSAAETKLMFHWEQHGFMLQADANSLVDAQAAIRTQPVDLILIDLKHSARPAGCCSVNAIREHSRVPIILLGGSHDFQLLREAIAFQVSDYIADPVQPEDLAASLHKVKVKISMLNLFTPTL